MDDLQENLPYFRQLDFNTGNIKLVKIELPEGFGVYEYFRSINILNESASVYGLVYLATDNMLGFLQHGKY